MAARLPVLTNIPPPNLRRKAACDKLLHTVEMNPDWPVHQDFFNHPAPRLKSRKPIWSDTTPVDVTSKWKEDCQSNSVTNKNLISAHQTSGLQSPASNMVNAKPFPHWTGPLCCQSTQMAHGPYTDRCQCGDVQTMIHIVDSCPLTRFADGDLFRLHSADDGAVTWLQDVAAKALAK